MSRAEIVDRKNKDVPARLPDFSFDFSELKVTRLQEGSAQWVNAINTNLLRVLQETRTLVPAYAWRYNAQNGLIDVFFHGDNVSESDASDVEYPLEVSNTGAYRSHPDLR